MRVSLLQVILNNAQCCRQNSKILIALRACRAFFCVRLWERFNKCAPQQNAEQCVVLRNNWDFCLYLNDSGRCFKRSSPLYRPISEAPNGRALATALANGH